MMPTFSPHDRVRLARTLLVAAALAVAALPARAAEYQVDTTRIRQVRFLSQAPIEDFEGITSRIGGYAYWTGDSLTAGTTYEGSEVYFEVPLNALSTGIDMRDRHMRENYLHTDRFPYVSYKGTIKSVQGAGNDTLVVLTHGQLDLHGQRKDYDIACRLAGTRSLYALSANFEIKLPDFGIEVPSLMFMKISETIKIEVNFYVAPVE